MRPVLHFIKGTIALFFDTPGPLGEPVGESAGGFGVFYQQEASCGSFRRGAVKAMAGQEEGAHVSLKR